MLFCSNRQHSHTTDKYADQSRTFTSSFQESCYGLKNFPKCDLYLLHHLTMMKRIVFTIVCIKLLGQTLVLRPRQKTVLSLGHVNGKIKFTFTIGAGIPERPSWQYFASPQFGHCSCMMGNTTINILTTCSSYSTSSGYRLQVATWPGFSARRH